MVVIRESMTANRWGLVVFLSTSMRTAELFRDLLFGRLRRRHGKRRFASVSIHVDFKFRIVSVEFVFIIKLNPLNWGFGVLGQRVGPGPVKCRPIDRADTSLRRTR